MNKYIIKNCPCFNEGHYDLRFSGECLDLTQDENECCADCTDCLLKRIVEKCKSYEEMSSCYDCTWGGGLAKEILSMLEIEECG